MKAFFAVKVNTSFHIKKYLANLSMLLSVVSMVSRVKQIFEEAAFSIPKLSPLVGA
jgi:hypothetical protein